MLQEGAKMTSSQKYMFMQEKAPKVTHLERASAYIYIYPGGLIRGPVSYSQRADKEPPKS